MKPCPQTRAAGNPSLTPGLRLSTSSIPLEFASETQPPGRPFLPSAELELGPVLRQAASSIPVPAGRSMAIFPEFPLPAGIPDLVVLVADRTALRARIESGVQPIISEQEVRIVMKASPHRGVSLETVYDVTGVSDSQAKRLLSRLVSHGALRKKNDRWYRHPSLLPVGRTYAIEAKVSDWRSGFAQSLRYGAYADATGLVLGGISPRVSKCAREAAIRHSVGLFLEGRWVRRPTIRRISPERRLWVSEHIIANLVG